MNVGLPDLDLGAEVARSFLPEASRGLSFLTSFTTILPGPFMVSFFSIFVLNIGGFAKSPWVTVTILPCGKD